MFTYTVPRNYVLRKWTGEVTRGRAKVAVTSGRDEWRKRVIAYEALLHRLTGALSVRSLVVVGAWLLVGRQD